MKITIKVQIEADQIACFGGEWFCDQNCAFYNDDGQFCHLFRKNMSRRLTECIAAQEWSEAK